MIRLLAKQNIRMFALGVLFVLLLSACSPPSPVATVEPTPPAEDGETGQPAETSEGEAYPEIQIYRPQVYPDAETPVAAAEAYPLPTLAPTAQPYPEAVPFQLDKPITAGTTQVTGTGPAGIPIWILDYTFGGAVLGQGVIADDGAFSIQVSELEANHRIGIVLGDLEGTEWQPENFYFRQFYGDDPKQVPMVDFFFDTAMVQP